ncbi:MAG: hypothetical protein ACI88A_000042 [Paraglaciecola sp.]|jgi:hypothetical protein
MKILVCAVLLATLIGQGNALAHSDHGVISGQTAVRIASKSVKQLTFKDFGFAVGKLDASWAELTADNFSVVEVLDNSYIISAKNMASKKNIFLQIANSGQLLKVKNSNEF